MKENLDDHNLISEGYYDLVFKKKKGLQSKWHHLKFKKILSSVPGHKKVLNIACSAGTLDPLIEAESVVGLDFSLKQLFYANSNNSSSINSYVCGDACRLPLRSNSFDLVLASEFIEHIDSKSYESFLNEIYRVLKPGGELVMTTPNYRSLWPVLENLLNKLGDVDYADQHINKFTPSKLLSTIENTGLFSVIKLESFLLFSPFVATVDWNLSDTVYKKESFLSSKTGFLLYCHLKVNKE